MTPPAAPADLDDLMPELRDWNRGAGIDPRSWVATVGGYSLAIGYSLIFWPRFERFGPYVLRSGAFCTETVRGFEDATGGDRRAVEAAINHVHMADLHDNDPEPSEAQLRYLGRVLKDIHEAKLTADFPGLRFEVSFPDEPGLDPLDYELTFWQV